MSQPGARARRRGVGATGDRRERPPVVLLHGLGRSQLSMARLRRRLEAAGWPTWCRTYPSRRLAIEDLAELVAGWIKADLGDREIAAVTHSLGGLVARQIGDRLRWQRVVMLAPPNRGSAVARKLEPIPVFRWVFGPAARQIAVGPSFSPLGCPVGVIAGDAGTTWRNPPSLGVRLLGVHRDGRPHDGTVAVHETSMAEMTDFRVVPATHTWIMDHPRTLPLILQFLSQGRFDRP